MEIHPVVKKVLAGKIPQEVIAEKLISYLEGEEVDQVRSIIFKFIRVRKESIVTDLIMSMIMLAQPTALQQIKATYLVAKSAKNAITELESIEIRLAKVILQTWNMVAQPGSPEQASDLAREMIRYNGEMPLFEAIQEKINNFFDSIEK